MSTRNTKQKQIILEVLHSDKTHPTILELYQKIKDKNHNIGQATVYRNINKLVEEKRIKLIPTTQNVNHYDCDCSDHYHIVCKKCGCVRDIFDDEIDGYISSLAKKHHLQIIDYNVLFEGVCDVCNQERGINEEV